MKGIQKLQRKLFGVQQLDNPPVSTFARMFIRTDPNHDLPGYTDNNKTMWMTLKWSDIE